MHKRTKIIATIGPASSSPAVIAKLIRAGMDAARLNFSHGDWNDHMKRIRLLRQEAEKAGKQIAIIQDLQGPKLRVGVMQNDAVTLRRGDAVTVTPQKVMGTNSVISVTYPRLKKDLKIGATVLLDDGRLELNVVKKSAAGLVCKVVRGGVLKSHKGVNLPGARLSLSSLSPKDKSDLRFGIARGVDYIALSFVR
ncbi:MAG TPA: pyruvate kinase, partial [Nitrospirota bacterium]|nr:pyruvate kinase [Nitrospirota bacterium]